MCSELSELLLLLLRDVESLERLRVQKGRARRRAWVARRHPATAFAFWVGHAPRKRCQEAKKVGFWIIIIIEKADNLACLALSML